MLRTLQHLSGSLHCPMSWRVDGKRSLFGWVRDTIRFMQRGKGFDLMMTKPIPDIVASTLSLPSLLNRGMSYFENRQTFRILFLNVRSPRKLRLLQWAASEEPYPRMEQFGERVQMACCAILNSLWLLTVGSFSHIALSRGWKVGYQSENDRQLIVTFSESTQKVSGPN